MSIFKVIEDKPGSDVLDTIESYMPYLFLIYVFLSRFTGHISQVVARFFNLKQIYLVLSFWISGSLLGRQSKII